MTTHILEIASTVKIKHIGENILLPLHTRANPQKCRRNMKMLFKLHKTLCMWVFWDANYDFKVKIKKSTTWSTKIKKFQKLYNLYETSHTDLRKLITIHKSKIQKEKNPDNN